MRCSLLRARVWLLMPILSCIGGQAQGGHLRKVWEFHVPRQMNSTATVDSIFQVRFSDDGKRIAIVAGPTEERQRLIVVSAERPTADATVFDVSSSTPVVEPAVQAGQLDWSASGQQIVWGRTLVSLNEGMTCQLPGGGRFVGREEFAVYQFKPSSFVFLDLRCHVIREWESFPNRARVTDYEASRQRGMMIVRQEKVSGYSLSEIEDMLLDVETRDIVRHSVWHAATGSGDDNMIWPGQFADGGHAICGTRIHGKDTRVECSVADNGRVLGAIDTWNNPDIQASSASSRIVISNYWKKLDWVDFFWYRGSLRDRTIWDFRTGAQVTRWRPPTQEIMHQGSFKRVPFSFDSSPDGVYIAEGGNGVVSLYKVEA
jgi:hypothetical protein